MFTVEILWRDEMTCEQYWREGVERIERGESDPHRETCEDCQREHRAREQLIQSLLLVGDRDRGDPHWEARVWARIARLDAKPARGGWFFGSAFATACVIAIISWIVGREPVRDDSPRIEVMTGEVAARSIKSMRSAEATVGDQLRITVKPGEEVRIYHENNLVLCCPSGTTSGGCVSDGHGLVAEATLVTPGTYELVVITPEAARRNSSVGAPAPRGGLAKDLASTLDAGFSYQLTQLWVP
jgi:hypothetical protein